MRAKTGLVIGFRTSDVENHDELFKWHLCVCDRTHQYLYICKRYYPQDYEITSLHCDGLDYEQSYISMRHVSFVPQLSPKHKFGCLLEANFLRGLYDHIANDRTDAMTPIQKRRVLPGLARKISE
jgi:hypothetical protein